MPSALSTTPTGGTREGLSGRIASTVRSRAVRCHQGLADVAAVRGNQALVMEHLDAAGELIARYGAKLYLDQVLAKKQFLKA
jgi:hypothetical protein